MESYDALRIALAMFLPIAVRLLALRNAARTEPEAACVALTSRQLQVLRVCGRRPLIATPNNKQVLLALAALGGHLRSNGPPDGWCSAALSTSCSSSSWGGSLPTHGDPIDD
jgi:hypothetical protein